MKGDFTTMKPLRSISAAVLALSLAAMSVIIPHTAAVPSEPAEEYTKNNTTAQTTTVPHNCVQYTSSGEILYAHTIETAAGTKCVKGIYLDSGIWLNFLHTEDCEKMNWLKEGDRISITYIYDNTAMNVTDIISCELLDPEKDLFDANVTLVTPDGNEWDFGSSVTVLLQHISSVQPEVQPIMPGDIPEMKTIKLPDDPKNPFVIKGLVKGAAYKLIIMANSKGQENIAEPIVIKAGEDGSCDIRGTVNIVPYYRSGDVNYDGKLTVADLVLMSNYLLNAEGEYHNNRFWDITEDGVVNAFDLCALRAELTKASETK